MSGKEEKKKEKTEDKVETAEEGRIGKEEGKGREGAAHWSAGGRVPGNGPTHPRINCP